MPVTYTRYTSSTRRASPLESVTCLFWCFCERKSGCRESGFGMYNAYTPARLFPAVSPPPPLPPLEQTNPREKIARSGELCIRAHQQHRIVLCKPCLAQLNATWTDHARSTRTYQYVTYNYGRKYKVCLRINMDTLRSLHFRQEGYMQGLPSPVLYSKKK